MNIDEIIVEQLAKAAHEIFCESLTAKGYIYGLQTDDSRKAHSSLIPYDMLPEDEKEQNRSSVRDIPQKMGAIGYNIVPAFEDQTIFSLSDKEIEKLAEMEHERWIQAKLDAGWKYAPVTDKSIKLHQWIVPWSQLPGKEKDKDRVLVKSIPKILAKAGYVMVKASE